MIMHNNGSNLEEKNERKKNLKYYNTQYIANGHAVNRDEYYASSYRNGDRPLVKQYAWPYKWITVPWITFTRLLNSPKT